MLNPWWPQPAFEVMPQAEFMHMDEQQRRAHLPGFGVEPFADMPRVVLLFALLGRRVI